MEGQSLPSSSAWTAPQSICPQYTKSGPQPHKPAKWGIPGLACPAPSSRVQAQALGPHLTLGSCLLLSVSPITPPWYLPSFLIVDYNVLSTFFGKKKKVGGGRKEKEQISRNCFAAAVPVTWSKAVCHPLLLRLARSLGPAPSVFPFLPISLFPAAHLLPPKKNNHIKTAELSLSSS